MSDTIKTKLYALADALEMRLVYRDGKIDGQAKSDMELFAGYSPTIISSIEESLVDHTNSVVAVEGQIWGNLGFVCVVEDFANRISFFVIDRSKRPPTVAPWGHSWSRKELYAWLEYSCKAVYDRSVFDTEWELLENGPAKLKAYNRAREAGKKAKEAYELVWT